MKKPAVFFAILILMAGLGYGVVRLFMIRFAQGDVYPAYSTLRADGVGAKALHDSLAELMPVERNYRRLSELHPEGRNSTIFLLGASQGFEEDPDSADLQRLAQEGDRIVLAFEPYQEKPFEAWPTPEKTPKESGTNASDEKSDEKKAAELRKLWGVNIAYSTKLPESAKTEIAGLEPELSWHTKLYFDKLNPAWRTLYSCAGKPVIIERTFGDGSIALVADAYFSSNEALSKERAPGLISALAGNSGRVIFDETHLGVSEHPGVVSLMRKYELHSVVIALMLVAALFVWRNAVAFVPRRQEEFAGGEIVQGFDAAAAFVSLLRRNIPFDKLVETCLVEWKRSFGHRVKPTTVARVEALAVPGAKQPVQTFQMIMQILNEKK